MQHLVKWPNFLIIATSFLVSSSDGKSPCAPLTFGHDSHVCACNSSYCDDLEPPEVLPKREAYVVQSDKQEKRYEVSRGRFVQNGISNDAIELQIEQGIQFQTILGFGGALTDAAARNIARLTDTNLQEVLLKSLYHDSGNNYNLMRINMGGCDFSDRPYTYDDIKGDVDLAYFHLTEDDTLFKIPRIKMTQGFKPDIKIFATPWSAPAWMKTNNDLIGKGQLKSEFYQIWADYFVKFLQAYQDQDINLWGLTTQNSPRDGYIEDFNFNCMGWNSSSMAKWISENLGPSLDMAGFGELKVMMYDDQRDMVEEWVKEMLSNSEVHEYVDGIAMHWYADFKEDASTDPLDNVHKMFPEKFQLYSEACNLPDVKLGDWKRAERYLSNMIEDLNHWVTGWVDWNLALDMIGGPNWVGNWVDASIIINDVTQEFYKQPMYYALGHVSKFVPEGSKVVKLSPSKDDSVRAVAFIRDDEASVVVLLNKADETKEVAITDAELGTLMIELSPNSFSSVIFW